MSPAKLRVLLADDQKALLRKTKALLDPEFTVVATVEDGLDLLFRAAELQPDVVVTNLKIPYVDGVEAGRKLLDQKLCRAVVVLSTLVDPQTVGDAREAGILGFVTRDRCGTDLVPAIKAALDGKAFVSRSGSD